jgi:GAF domain-containing protein
MTERRVVAALTLLSVLCSVADTAISASFRSLLSRDSVVVHGWPLVTLAIVGSSLMGALIIFRYPRHVIGWLLTVVGSLSSVSILAETYMVWVLRNGGPGTDTLAHLSGWLSALTSAPIAFAGLTLMLLLVPDGRLLSPRWRIAVAVPIVGLATSMTAVLLTPPSDVRIDTDPTDASTLTSVLFHIGVIFLLGGIVVSVVSVLIRRHRARGMLRQQLRWISVWAVSLPTGLAILLALNGAESGPAVWLARMPLLLSYASLPLCLAIAVLRYRLYDIDVIINRAVVLACGTAFAAVGYIALVVGVGTLVDARTAAFWPSLLATGVVALAFQPLRRIVVRIADRIAYGGRAAPYEALAGFTRRLGESPDPALLLPAIAHAAVQAVSAQQATVRLRLPGESERVASWPADAEDTRKTTELPVIDRGETLGSITVHMPRGRALRAGDRALLIDLAGQSAVAFRNVRLSMELAAQVELLDRKTEELALSRARLIEARDAERSRLERAIRRDVTSHLDHLPRQLAAMNRNLDRGDTAAALAEMIKDSVDALEALRELSRGIFSTQLARFGLASAVSAHVRRAQDGSTFSTDDAMRERRFSSPIEFAAYFCYVTASSELCAPIAVDLSLRNDRLVITLRAEQSPEPDLVHLQDRLDPLGGDVTWTQAAARSVLTIRLPVREAARARSLSEVRVSPSPRSTAQRVGSG